MDPILLIFCVIALVAVSVLCVVGVMLLVDLKQQVRRTVIVVDTAGRDLQDIKHKLMPVLDEAKTTLQHTSRAIENADREIAKIGKGADTFVAIAEDVRRLEQQIVSRVQGPLEDVTNVINGALKGVTTFARQLFKK